MSYYFDAIIEIEDLCLIIFHWIKSYMKIFWFMTFHTKLCLVQNHCKFDEVDGFIRVCYGTRYLTLFNSKKMILLTMELDIFLVKKIALHMFFLNAMLK